MLQWILIGSLLETGVVIASCEEDSIIPVELGYHPELHDPIFFPETHPFMWANDSWFSQCKFYDKVEHYSAGFQGTIIPLLIGYKTGYWWLQDKAVVPTALTMAILWEVKDGFFSDGFSWKDMLASWVGIGIAWGLYRWCHEDESF
jgi:hypothetical protein